MDMEETTGLERVYRFVVDFIIENGYSPSIREICEEYAWLQRVAFMSI